MGVPLYPTDTVVIPPNESGNLSDDGHANEDHSFRYINNIAKDILNLMCKLVMYCTTIKIISMEMM